MALHIGSLAAAVVPFVAFFDIAAGSAFLGQAPSTSLFEELDGVLGASLRQAAESRATPLEDAMRPTFKALPKIGHDRLSWSGVRYLLHRVFVQRRGWQVNGIADDGAGFADPRATPGVVADVASEEAAALFERRHGGRGLTLHEVAVLAATLEAMVHEDVVERLEAAYNFAGLAHNESSADRIGLAVEYYMLMYLLRVNHTEATRDWIEDLQDNSRNAHVQESQRWARSVQQEVFGASSPEFGETFDKSVRTVEEVMDRYGLWQNYECKTIKSDLVALEWNRTGRVRLQDFYGEAMKGNYLFSESKDYLRDVGALDESNPLQPMVIIPNFLTSPATCLGGTRFYSVCCVNECEKLLRTFEEHIGAPEASTERVLELVQQLESPTVAAPRTLPTSLTERVKAIAASHGGRVPLHGRLFAQWLHHAFPRECPYPHLAGTTAPVRGPVWQEQTGIQFMANTSEMQGHIDQCVLSRGMSGDVPAGANSHFEVPWVHEEDLQVHGDGGHRQAAELVRSVVATCRIVAMVAVSTSVGAALIWTAAGSSRKLSGANPKSSAGWLV
mmetsp:Transcript_128318/g.371461  ORF Transcript_128318/g.371461 Transcript_128318/m.371461 type:complete len:559 (+) Transcript_128318:3-1679(+)